MNAVREQFLFLFTGVIILIVAQLLATVMTLFGPVSGGMLHVLAFLGTAALLVYVKRASQQGLLRDESSIDDKTRKIAKLVFITFGVCVIVWAVCFGIRGLFVGVTDHTHPIFASQTEYVLNNHGDKTVVSRWQYLVAGTAQELTWSSVVLGIMLLLLYVILAGMN